MKNSKNAKPTGSFKSEAQPLRHRRPRRPLAEIVAQINPASYPRRNAEMTGDKPVGREFW